MQSKCYLSILDIFLETEERSVQGQSLKSDKIIQIASYLINNTYV